MFGKKKAAKEPKAPKKSKAQAFKDAVIEYDNLPKDPPQAYIVRKEIADRVNAVALNPVSEAPKHSKMGNAPDGATPESHPHLFDGFSNPL